MGVETEHEGGVRSEPEQAIPVLRPVESPASPLTSQATNLKSCATGCIITAFIGGLAVMALVLLLPGGGSGAGPSTDPPPPATRSGVGPEAVKASAPETIPRGRSDAVPVPVKLAVIDGHVMLSDGRMSRPEGEEAVARFRFLLKEGARKTGDAEETIAGVAVRAQEMLLKEFGKRLSALQIMEGVNRSIPEGATGTIRYSDAAGTYIILYGRK